MPSSVEQKEKELSELEAEIANKKRDLSRITTSINAHALETENALAAKDTALVEAKEAQILVSGLRGEIDTLREIVASSQTSAQEEKIALEAARKKKEELQATVVSILEEISNINQRRDASLAELDASFLGRKKELEGKLQSLDQQVRLSADELTQLEARVKNIAMQCKDSEAQLSSITKQVKYAESERIALTSEIELLEQKIVDKNSRLQESLKSIAEHQDVANNLLVAEKKQLLVIDELKKEIESLKAEADLLVKAKINFANERDALAQREATIKSIYEKAGVPFPM